MEGEGAPSDEQTEDPTGQSGRNGVEFGLEIYGGGVDAAVAVDRGQDSRAALVSGQCRVLDIEELRADLQRAIGTLTAVYPDSGTVGYLLRGGEAVVSDGEANLFHDIPQRRVVGSIEHHLVALDSGTRRAGHGIDRLLAMEESELIALKKRCVVVDDGLRELSHGGCCGDGERAEGHAADQLVVAVLGHTDAGQGATCNLVGREDGAAVELHPLGDIDLDDPEIGLDEGVVDRHVCGQFLEATAQHRAELLVDSAEVGPLGADVHLLLTATGSDGLDGGFADDGTHLGLTVDILTYLATNLGVDSEYFCHCVLLLMLYILFVRPLGVSACAPTG